MSNYFSNAQFNSYTSFEFKGPLMVITQKVTSLAFSIHDGIAKKDSELSKNQQQYAVKVLPTPLEYFSFVLQFPTIMAGPVLFYNDYIEFIKGENLVYKPSSVSNFQSFLFFFTTPY